MASWPRQQPLANIRQVADALSYIHARNINHLDIKPKNVLIDGHGNEVVLDYGLSKGNERTWYANQEQTREH
jgi:Serine/threonine protein kinase